jgi:Tfp pilus assembly PilM family ATPase/Tfp pilus assembly protein PilN
MFDIVRKQDRWSRPFVVVDLDATSVRILEVSPSSHGPFLKWGAAMLDRANGKPFRQSATEALKKLLTNHAIKTKEVRLLLSGPSTVTLPIDLPPLPPKELPNAVRWSAVRGMPFPLAEAVLDHFLLGSKGKENEQTVLVAAITRAALNESVNILQAVGLSPVQATLIPLALNGLMQALPVKGTETTLLLDLRPHMATMIFFHGRELSLVRNLTADSGAGSRGDTTAKGALSRLIDEIWLSLAYYQERFAGEKIQRLWVAGSPQDLEKIKPALSEAVGIPVEPVDLSAVLPFGRDEPPPPTLAAAAGVLYDPSQLNLLPREIRHSKHRKVIRTALRAVVAAAVLAVVTWTGLEFLGMRQKRQEVAEQQAALKHMSALSGEVRSFEQASSSLAPHLSVYEEPLAFNRRWIGALKAFSALTPPNVSLTALEADESRGIKVEGLAFADVEPPEVLLSEFMTRLSESPYFGSVRLASSKEKSGYTHRTIAFNLILGWR